MGAPALAGITAFAALFAFHAYRTAYIYPTIPRAFFLGDFAVAAVSGVVVAGIVFFLIGGRA